MVDLVNAGVEPFPGEAQAMIDGGSSITDPAQVQEGAEAGPNCTVGHGPYLVIGVRTGHSCRRQEHGLAHEAPLLESGVFVRPAPVFTNHHVPRAVSPDDTSAADMARQQDVLAGFDSDWGSVVGNPRAGRRHSWPTYNFRDAD